MKFSLYFQLFCDFFCPGNEFPNAEALIEAVTEYIENPELSSESSEDEGITGMNELSLQTNGKHE